MGKEYLPLYSSAPGNLKGLFLCRKEIAVRAAIIDIGSRSTKLLIGETAKEDIALIESLKNTTPIAHDTFLKERISQETITQTVAILEKYKKVLKDYEISEVKVFATTAVREARNRDIFVDAVLRKTGLEIEILTVGDIVYYIDAYLSHKLKDSYPIHEKNLLIAELGSGSLDISVMEQGFTLMNLGLPIGTLRLKQTISRFNGSLEEVFQATQEYLANEFSYVQRMLPNIIIDDIMLIDENYSSFLPNIIGSKKTEGHLFTLTLEDTKKLLETLAGRTPEEISRSFRIPLDAAETITGYAVMLNLFCTLARNQQIYTLETSLAEAVLAHTLLELETSKKYNKTNQLISVARNICRKYNMDLAHSQYVAGISETLFSSLKEHLGLKKDALLYLLLASYLHDIGMFIHNRAHHKHSEYIISSLNLFRLTDLEIKIIAAIARYHRKAPPSEMHLIYGSLPTDKQILVQKLSALLRIANSLDHSHAQKVTKLEVKINQNQSILLTAYSQGNCILEQDDFQDKKALFEEITGSKISLVLKGA